jgi:outer membrane protein assembly factor BamB
MFRGSPAHTGVYPAPSHALEGKVAWSFEALNWDAYRVLEDQVGDFIWPTTPAIVADRLYFNVGPYFFAIDTAGKQLYRVRLAASSLASPAVEGGLAYLPTTDGKLLALDVKDGSVRWSAVIGAPNFLHQVDTWDVYHSSPTVVDGVVYVGSADGRIYALSAADGKERWHFQTNHVVRATPAVVQGRVYCGSFDGNIYALEAASGKLVWKVATKTPGVPWYSVQSSCAVVNGVVYVGSRSTFLYAIEASMGKVLWAHNHDGSWVPSSPAVRDGISYVGQSDGSKITAVDVNGKTLWAYNSPNETFSSPALAGDVLYVGGNDNYNQRGKGSLSALDAKTGKELWKLEMPASVWASPVVAGDTVYVSCADGKVYAVK